MNLNIRRFCVLAFILMISIILGSKMEVSEKIYEALLASMIWVGTHGFTRIKMIA